MKKILILLVFSAVFMLSFGIIADDQSQTPQEHHPKGTKGGPMVLVPEGEFTMGCDSGTGDEMPVHKVTLDQFYIDKYEVTNELYDECMKAGKCTENTKYNGFTDPQQPVVGVSWLQADKYCKWAGKRLPTEAEWEKAAKGTDGRSFPWGGYYIDCSRANYKECQKKKTVPVGSYPSGASPYGALDMAGNVWEWTADWYDHDYYQKSPSRNPKGPPTGTQRTMRGGDWAADSFHLRSSTRAKSDPDGHNTNGWGFRCARN